VNGVGVEIIENCGVKQSKTTVSYRFSEAKQVVA
jgi:hypothetical protein